MSNSDKSWNRHLSTASNLNIWVSKWKRGDVEKELHISCSGPVTPSFILQKIDTTELSKKQDEYVGKVQKYLQFIDVDFMDLFQEEIFTRDSKGSTRLLKDVLKEIEIEAKKDSDRMVNWNIMKFTKTVADLITPCEEFRLHARRTIYEVTFTRFVSGFANLCCLEPVCCLANDKDSQSVWPNFRGTECAVSEPDIRLKKFGLPDEEKTKCSEEQKWVVVSVVEVKSASELRPILMRETRRDDVDELSRRMELSRIRPLASSSFSSESTSADDSFTVPYPPRNRRKKADSSDVATDLSFLPIYNSHKVLGQHAGELLFDLHKYFKDTDFKIATMPGMIIDGVKVIFTLLEMKYEHLKKLRENKELDDEDKAVIYYSSPYSILTQRDRNIVLEYFMRLNNMVNYGHNDTVKKEEEKCKDQE